MLLLSRSSDGVSSETLVSLIVPPNKLPALKEQTAGDEGSAAEGDTKIVAGSTGLNGVPFLDHGDVPPGTWSRCSGSTFKIRQLGYKQSKKKAPSSESFYEVVAVDLFDTESRQHSMAATMELPTPERASPDDHIPSLFVVNAMIPSETGPMRVKPDADGRLRGLPPLKE